MLKNRFIAVFVVVGALLLTSGCAVNRATASLTPGSDLTKVKSFYVVKVPEDSRGIDALIRTKLAKKGYTVTTASDQKADVVLTYVDKWMWDITMYMLELTLTMRDPKNNFPIAVGNSYHTSLTRKSPEEMVDEVLTNIFNAPKQ